MIFDYETLRCIWWVFLWLLIVNFAITGGFDLGVGILLPFLGKNDDERRVIINAIAPSWEGNQVWFITAGGALFAAWPTAYAVMFSGFYFALFLTLLALILRPLGFDYRSKLPSEKWRYNWDKALFLGGFVPALVFGVAIGNLLKGVPFHLDSDMRVIYYGDLWGLLNPFALLVGISGVALLVMHGAVYLQIKTEGEIAARAKAKILPAVIVTLIRFALAGLWVMRLEGYHITSDIIHDGASNPLAKFVKRAEGLWLDNYEHIPALAAIPALAFICGGLTVWLSKQDRAGLAFISSSVTILCMISTAALSMFPFLIPSNMSLNSSLTVWDASSSHATLHIMFWATVIFLPIVVVYSSWVFRVLRGKVTVEQIQKNPHGLY